MASRRKRGPVAFRPRLSAGLAVSLLLLRVVQIDDFSSWIIESNIFWPIRNFRLWVGSSRSPLAGFLLQCPVDSAGFARVSQVPFVQLGDNLLHLARHGLDAPLSAAVNGVGAFKRNHIAIPVGAFPAGRRLCSPDRYDLVGLFQC